jgi:hypothetical protein
MFTNNNNCVEIKLSMPHSGGRSTKNSLQNMYKYLFYLFVNHKYLILNLKKLSFRNKVEVYWFGDVFMI